MTILLRRRVVTLVLALFGVVASLDIYLAYRNRGYGAMTVTNTVGFDVAMMAFVITGTVLVVKRAGGSLGGLFCWIATGAVTGSFAQQYGLLLHRETVDVLLDSYLFVAGQQLFAAAVMSALFLLMLFPSGSLPSPRWRIVAYLVASAIALSVLVGFLISGPVFGGEGMTNPFSIENLAGFAKLANQFVGILTVPAVLLAVVAPFVRYRNAAGIEGHQLKVFAYSAGLMFVLAFPVNAMIRSLAPALTDTGFVLGMGLLPIGVGVAVLRYRLYDIDVIINRTLVYGVLTAVLLSSYLLTVVTLSRVLDPVTRDSDIAVAASTLAVAALFRPLRARVQGFIDRRFYRSKYDSTEALKSFSTRLRDEIEVDVVSSDVLGVVQDTLQPRHASVWLRAGGIS